MLVYTLGYALTYPFSVYKKWWMTEGSKEWRKEGQNSAKSVSELLGQWNLNRSSLAWNNMGKNQTEYIAEIF